MNFVHTLTALQLLTAAIQAGLVGGVVYLVLYLVREELEDRRWWNTHLQAMKGKSAWKPGRKDRLRR